MTSLLAQAQTYDDLMWKGAVTVSVVGAVILVVAFLVRRWRK